VTDIPRGRHIGRRIGDPPKDEAEHFSRCPACEGWIDCRERAGWPAIFLACAAPPALRRCSRRARGLTREPIGDGRQPTKMLGNSPSRGRSCQIASNMASPLSGRKALPRFGVMTPLENRYVRHNDA
jgi:hypothetical protein